MTREDWLELAKGPIDSSRIDDLEALAKAHESLAYRYRSAASLLRKRASEHSGESPDSAASSNEQGPKPENSAF